MYGVQWRGFGTVAAMRNSSFSTVTDYDISCFIDSLWDANVIWDEDALQSANMDWMRKFQWSSNLMLLPRSSKEVSQILTYCNSRSLAVVPQGGNTGLVAAIPRKLEFLLG